MSSAIDATVRPRYGSMCAATATPRLSADATIACMRRSSGDPFPHHDTAISSIPAERISLICASITSLSEDEYRPIAG